jgi:hypothetical protein
MFLSTQIQSSIFESPAGSDIFILQFQATAFKNTLQFIEKRILIVISGLK